MHSPFSKSITWTFLPFIVKSGFQLVHQQRFQFRSRFQEVWGFNFLDLEHIKNIHELLCLGDRVSISLFFFKNRLFEGSLKCAKAAIALKLLNKQVLIC